MSVLLSSCINLGDIKLGGTFETEGDKIEAMSDEIIRCLTDDDKIIARTYDFISE